MYRWLLGAAAVVSYAVVPGNLGGLFPHEHSDLPYFESSYWVGLPKATTMFITALQPFAAIGYVAWTRWALGACSEVAAALSETFLVSSLAWPFAAYLYVRSPDSILIAGLACLPLVIAAAAVIGMVAVTFRCRAPAAPTIGVMALGAVVVVADAIVWTHACILNTHRARGSG